MDVRPILAALEAHPDVHVSFAKIEEGASEDLLKQVEKGLQVESLHPLIREFYQKQNGVCIRWCRKGGSMYKYYKEAHGDITKELRQEEEAMGVLDAETVLENDETIIVPCDGMLFFPPIEEVLTEYDDEWEVTDYSAKAAWSEHILYLHESDDDKLKKPFDFNGKSYETKHELLKLLRFHTVTINEAKPMLLFQKGLSDPLVFHVDTSITCIHDSPYCRMTLSKYLVMALRHCGLVYRVDFWFRPPPRQFFPVPIAETDLPVEENLSRVLAYLEKQYSD